jgi:hypothetical protein
VRELVVERPHHFLDSGGCQLSSRELIISVEMFPHEGLHRIHLLQQSATPKEHSRVAIVVCQKFPFGLEVSIVGPNDSCCYGVVVTGSIDIMEVSVGQSLGVEEWV